MTATVPLSAPVARQSSLSVPVRGHAPRPLDATEIATQRGVADTLIPARGQVPSASAEPEFLDRIAVALDARADAFDSVVTTLAELDGVPAGPMFQRLADLDATNPLAFQALSTVVAGAWLLTPGVQERTGYHGPQSSKAGLDEAVDEITSGVLDPVLERDPAAGPRWVR